MSTITDAKAADARAADVRAEAAQTNNAKALAQADAKQARANAKKRDDALRPVHHHHTHGATVTTFEDHEQLENGNVTVTFDGPTDPALIASNPVVLDKEDFKEVGRTDLANGGVQIEFQRLNEGLPADKHRRFTLAARPKPKTIQRAGGDGVAKA